MNRFAWPGVFIQVGGRTLRYLKIMKFAVAAIAALSLLFLSACRDRDESSDKTVRISISPSGKSVESGQVVEITVNARNTAIKWPETGTVPGSYAVSGNRARYTPPLTKGTYKFTVAAEADASKTVTATITVYYADPVVTIKPNDAEIKVSKTVQLSATYTTPRGTPKNQKLSWSAGNCGSLEPDEGDTVVFSGATVGSCSVSASLRNSDNQRVSGSVNVKVTETTLDNIMDDMVEVRGGTFTMGCTAADGKSCPERAVSEHPVTLNTFYIGKYEVTQYIWKQIMGTYGNTSGNAGDNFPVENVSWNDIVGTDGDSETVNGITYYSNGFIYRLNDRTGKKYRLPTEAEWEYAARGGNQSKGYLYSGSNTLDDVGWYEDNSYKDNNINDKKTHPVGLKQANELGLYDMSGNVAEWVIRDSQSVPSGTPLGFPRRVRGGSSNHDEEAATVFTSGGCSTGCDPNYFLGFRLAATSK
jgi:formylglycine-generating enzyme required for sulfatase activity